MQSVANCGLLTKCAGGVFLSNGNDGPLACLGGTPRMQVAGAEHGSVGTFDTQRNFCESLNVREGQFLKNWVQISNRVHLARMARL
jgi:hypothetical protein